MKNIISLKNLRENMQTYSQKVEQGHSFIVLKRSKPIFRILPVEDSTWEEVIDFTQIKKGGVDVKDLLARL